MTDDPPATPPPGGQPQALTDMLPGDTEDYSAWVERLEPIARQRVGWMHDRISELTDRLRAVEAALDEARSEIMRLQDNDSAYDFGYQRADAAAGVALDWLRQERDEACARASHFEALARDQQATNEVMVASLQRGLEKLQASEALARDQQATNVKMLAFLERGLAQLEASEAEVARLRQVLLDTRRNDGHWYGCWTNDGSSDRCSPECALFAETLAVAARGRAPADDCVCTRPHAANEIWRCPRHGWREPFGSVFVGQGELRRTGQGKLGRLPAGEGYPTKTCDHPEMADRHLVAPTTFRAVCWCGRNYACPTCGFGAFTLSHECAPPAPADQPRRERADDGE
jgi:hypothetical protein